jgi:hypothetical protein
MKIFPSYGDLSTKQVEDGSGGDLKQVNKQINYTTSSNKD